MIESELVEFKKTTRDLNEAVVSISSMLNKHKKGTIYFGVKNNGEPIKFEITDSTLRDISRKIYEFIKPQIFPVIELDKINGVEVIKVSFEGDEFLIQLLESIILELRMKIENLLHLN